MDGWLNEDFEMDQAVTGRIVAGVRQRVARRRRNRAALGSILSLCFVGILVGSFAMRGWRPSADGRATASDARPPVSNETAEPSSTAPRPAPLDVSLEKMDHTVAVTWGGNPQSEYMVYRCESPRFETCSLADRVKGTQWVDPVQGSGPVVFYRVEPRG